ncbi:hypothetical protein [Nonomuraea sp. NPDC049504]|uniref:hypothetical protein n=1 Tax=Nonomuraea sp. NPDC049504 TaxID=3154729 RepID=UPI003446BCDC
MTLLTTSRTRRTLAALVALSAAVLVGSAAVLVGPAAHADVTWSVVPANADVTWSVVPANTGGPDGRTAIDLELAGGQQTVEHVAVINRSTEPVVFGIDAGDGYLTSKGYFDMRPSGVEPVDGGSWITVPETVTVAAGATSVVPVTVSVPTNATPGDHPAGVTASLETVSGQVRVQNRVGVRLNIRVTGDYVAKLSVTGVSAAYTASWNPFTPGTVAVTYTVANTGNVRAVTGNQVLTSTLFTENTWTDPSTPRSRELMPGGRRTFTARLPGAWPLGPIGTTIVALPSPATGPLPGVAAQQAAATTRVWALPWPQLTLAALLTLAVVVLRLNAARRRKRIEKLIALAQQA